MMKEKKYTLGLKVTADVKQRLDETAKRTGKTQSQVAEQRLRLALIADDQIRQSSKLSSMGHLVTNTMMIAGAKAASEIGKPNWSAKEWMEDPHCYKSAMVAVWEVLSALAPDEKEDSKPDIHTMHEKISPGFETIQRGNTIVLIVNADRDPEAFDLEKYESDLRAQGNVVKRVTRSEKTTGSLRKVIASINDLGRDTPILFDSLSDDLSGQPTKDHVLDKICDLYHTIYRLMNDMITKTVLDNEKEDNSTIL